MGESQERDGLLWHSSGQDQLLHEHGREVVELILHVGSNLQLSYPDLALFVCNLADSLPMKFVVLCITKFRQHSKNHLFYKLKGALAFFLMNELVFEIKFICQNIHD